MTPEHIAFLAEAAIDSRWHYYSGDVVIDDDFWNGVIALTALAKELAEAMRWLRNNGWVDSHDRIREEDEPDWCATCGERWPCPTGQRFEPLARPDVQALLAGAEADGEA